MCLEGRPAYGALVATFERWRRLGLHLTRIAAHPRDYAHLVRDLGVEAIHGSRDGTDGVFVYPSIDARLLDVW
jgi:hypothetical protein